MHLDRTDFPLIQRALFQCAIDVLPESPGQDCPADAAKDEQNHDDIKNDPPPAMVFSFWRCLCLLGSRVGWPRRILFPTFHASWSGQPDHCVLSVPSASACNPWGMLPAQGD